MELKVGDKVKVIDEDETGVIVKVQSRNLVSVQCKDFTYNYSTNKLLLLEKSERSLEELYQAFLPGSEHIKAADKPKKKRVSREEKAEELGKVRGKRNSKNLLEFDLHIHDLLVKHSHMTAGEMLNYQLDYAVNCLEEAIKKRESTIIFIHGLGKGVLKTELHQIINAYGLDYQDGFMQEYGHGATRVEIR